MKKFESEMKKIKRCLERVAFSSMIHVYYSYTSLFRLLGSDKKYLIFIQDDVTWKQQKNVSAAT
jgi:hypothetical protein